MEGTPQAFNTGQGIPLHLVGSFIQEVKVSTRPSPLYTLTGPTASRVPGALSAPLDLPVHLFFVTPGTNLDTINNLYQYVFV